MVAMFQGGLHWASNVKTVSVESPRKLLQSTSRNKMSAAVLLIKLQLTQPVCERSFSGQTDICSKEGKFEAQDNLKMTSWMQNESRSYNKWRDLIW